MATQADEQPADPDPSPRLLQNGRYRISELIGRGSQAETFAGEEIQSGRMVAIKRFSVRGARSWKDVELAEREARVLAELDHPNLPKYLDRFEEGGALYLVMEKVEGPTLAELRRRGGISQAVVVNFLRDAGRTLAYLHGRAPPLIHRDIKPHNVIRRPNGSFALVDFGSVRDRLRPEGGSTVVGTFGYMAPEQFQGRALPGSDVYGVAATAISCLTGQEPETLPHRGLGIDVHAALGNRFDPALTDLLSRLLEPDPDKRPGNLETALNQALQSRTEVRAAPVPERGQARQDEQRLRRELREARRRRKRERRAERRAARHRGLPVSRAEWRRRGPVAPLVLLVVMLALFAARLATFGLFRVALPIALGVLAVFFGGGLRRAAERCAEIGRVGEEALRRAAEKLQELLRSPESEDPEVSAEKRYRVESSAGQPGSRDEASDWESESTRETEEHRRRGRD